MKTLNKILITLGIFFLPLIAYGVTTVPWQRNNALNVSPLYPTDGVNIGTTTATATLSIQGSGTLNPFTVASSSGLSLLTVLANGNVGVGSTTPSAPLSVTGHAVIDNSDNLNSVIGTVPTNAVFTPGNGLSGALYVGRVNTNSNVVGMWANSTLIATGTGATLRSQAFNYGANDASTSTTTLTSTVGGGALVGGRGVVSHDGNGNLTEMSVVSGLIRTQNSTGTITSARFLNSENPTISSGTTITNYSALEVKGGTVSGTLTNRYGVLIDDLQGGLNRYGIYQAGGSDLNYFGGKIGIGATPTQALTLAAASTINSLGDLTITSGGNSGAFLLTAADGTTSNMQGGSFGISAGNATLGNALGGTFGIGSGNGSGSGNGGPMNFTGGIGGATGEGGIISLQGGDGGASGGDGGSIQLEGGEGQAGTSNGGDIRFKPAFTSGSGRNGQTQFYSNDLTAIYTWFDLTKVDLGAGNLQVIFPGLNVSGDASGTVMLGNLGRTTAQTAAVANVKQITVPGSDASYLISANANVTAFVAGTFNVQVDYTDETNTARTLTLNFSSLTGTIGVALAAAGPFEGLPSHIRAKASTTITVKTTGVFTSLTYNVEGNITQIK